MSTMKVTNLKHESSSVNNIVLNSDGSVGGELATTLASKLDLAGGKILQVVRDTGTNITTTSTTFVDVTGLSVTITPQKSDSAIILIMYARAQPTGIAQGRHTGQIKITDSSGTDVGSTQTEIGIRNYNMSGAAGGEVFSYFPATIIGYATPNTTSAVTYKVQCAMITGAQNFAVNSSQLYAIEVSA